MATDPKLLSDTTPLPALDTTPTPMTPAAKALDQAAAEFLKQAQKKLWEAAKPELYELVLEATKPGGLTTEKVKQAVGLLKESETLPLPPAFEQALPPGLTLVKSPATGAGVLKYHGVHIKTFPIMPTSWTVTATSIQFHSKSHVLDLPWALIRETEFWGRIQAVTK